MKRASEKTDADAPTASLDRAENPVPDRRVFTAGTVLGGRYLLTAASAEGGTSKVFKARDLLAERSGGSSKDELAIKVICNLDDPRLALTIAQHETWINRFLMHEGILRIHSFDRCSGTCFLVMEWVAGESLSQRLLRNPDNRLPLNQATSIAQVVAAALKSAHDCDIIHSDIKPGNILLADSGHVKIIDFATARTPVAQASTPAAERKPLPFLGYSTAYTSPEILRDEPARPHDDVYSLACVLYEMLAGKPPFADRSSLEAQRAGVQPRRPPALDFWQWQVLKKGLAFDRKRRFADPHQFVARFRAARFTRITFTLVVTAAVLAATAVAAVGWSASHGTDTGSSLNVKSAIGWSDNRQP